LFIRNAPARVKIIQLVRHAVGMMIARAENDRLLQWIAACGGFCFAGGEQSLEQMFAHCFDAFGHHQPRFERAAFRFLSNRFRREATTS